MAHNSPKNDVTTRFYTVVTFFLVSLIANPVSVQGEDVSFLFNGQVSFGGANLFSFGYNYPSQPWIIPEIDLPPKTPGRVYKPEDFSVTGQLHFSVDEPGITGSVTFYCAVTTTYTPGLNSYGLRVLPPSGQTSFPVGKQYSLDASDTIDILSYHLADVFNGNKNADLAFNMRAMYAKPSEVTGGPKYTEWVSYPYIFYGPH